MYRFKIKQIKLKTSGLCQIIAFDWHKQIKLTFLSLWHPLTWNPGPSPEGVTYVWHLILLK